MPVRDYELVVVFNPEIDEENAAQNMGRITSMIESG